MLAWRVGRGATMSVASAIEALRGDARLGRNVAELRVLPAEAARYGEWPAELDPRLAAALARRGAARPYTHQERATRGALDGRDQVVVTPTASGKSLCYLVPVMEAVARDPSARSLLLFPTKALAQDQLTELHALVEAASLPLRAHTYDGDTAPSARRAVRTAGHVVITNPDMLHAGVLPNHTRWVRLFENLRYVVIDELHSYRGVFGSHVAQLLRRLRRICRFYGSDPVFLCSSATIANPGELAEALVGRPVEVVAESGAPRGERTVLLYNPPLVNRELGLRRSRARDAERIAALLAEHDVQSILFAGSRSQVELSTQRLREGRPQPPGGPSSVRGYRSGYLPRERRAIEAGLRNGAVRTVVATSALELGIDIGGLDAAVLSGYPGTLASLWQQLGRAGRRSSGALGVLVAGSSPLDQYVVGHPEYAFGEGVEAGLVHPDNPVIAAEHLKCAVFELPLEPAEHPSMGARTAELLSLLVDEGTVHEAEGRAYWSSEAYPAEEISLRRGDEKNVVIVELGPPRRVIGEVDRPSAMVLVHDEAIYVHDGRQHYVERLDWEELTAYVRPVDVDYYTDAHVAVDLRVIEEWEGGTGIDARAATAEPAPGDAVAAPASALPVAHGEVAVTYLATIFKKITLHGGENVGWGTIRLPQDDLHTTAFWLALPEWAVEGWPRAEVEAALGGVGRLVHNVAPLLAMCDPRDLHLATQLRSPHTGRPTAFLWEAVPGGVGMSAHLHREAPRLLRLAAGLLANCGCTEGCPGCVGPPAPGEASSTRAGGGALAPPEEAVDAPPTAAPVASPVASPMASKDPTARLLARLLGAGAPSSLDGAAGSPLVEAVGGAGVGAASGVVDAAPVG